MVAYLCLKPTHGCQTSLDNAIKDDRMTSLTLGYHYVMIPNKCTYFYNLMQSQEHVQCINIAPINIKNYSKRKKKEKSRAKSIQIEFLKIYFSTEVSKGMTCENSTKNIVDKR